MNPRITFVNAKDEDYKHPNFKKTILWDWNEVGEWIKNGENHAVAFENKLYNYYLGQSEKYVLERIEEYLTQKYA